MEATESNESISRAHFGIGTVIAVMMGTVFTLLSSGASLRVTFVPGVVFLWLGFAFVYIRRVAAPDVKGFLPLFLVTLAVQFVHFFEEFSNGFQTQFAIHYGGTAYTDIEFVLTNMVAYAIFVVSAILVTFYRLRFLIVPMMFFVVYGAIGNAIAHTTWSVLLGDYFPGLITAQIYWILGPLLLRKWLGSWKAVTVFVGGFGATLVFLLTVFMER